MIYNIFIMVMGNCFFCAKLQKIDKSSLCFFCNEREKDGLKRKNNPQKETRKNKVKRNLKPLADSKIKRKTLEERISKKQKKYLKRIYDANNMTYNKWEVDFLSKKQASKLINKYESSEMKKQRKDSQNVRIIDEEIDDILLILWREGFVSNEKWSFQKATHRQKKYLKRLLNTSKISAQQEEIDSLTKGEASALISFIIQE